MTTSEPRSALAGAAAAVGDAVVITVGEDAAFADIALRMGWRLDRPPPLVRALAGPAADVVAAANAVVGSPGSAEAWAQLGVSIGQLLDALNALTGGSFGDALDALQFGEIFPRELLHLLVYEYLRLAHPRLAAIARVLGIVRRTRVPAQGGRADHTRIEIVMPDLATALRSPRTLWQVAWAWGTADLDLTGLLDELVVVLRSLGAVAGYELSDVAGRLSGASPPLQQWTVVADALHGASADGEYRVGLRIVPLFDADGAPGLALLPIADGVAELSIPISDDTSVTLRGAASAEGGLAVVVRPGGDIELLGGFEGGNPLPRPGAALAVAVARGGASAANVFGPIAGASIHYQGWNVELGVGARTGSDVDVWAEVALRDARLVIDGGIAPLVPSTPIEIPLPLVIGISRSRGVYLGAQGLAVTVATDLALGPLRVNRLDLALTATAGALALSATVDLGLALGPVELFAAGVGAAIGLAQVERGGSLGPVDVTTEPRLPSRLGVAVTSSLISGSGFLARVDHGFEGGLMLDVQWLQVAALAAYHEPAPGKRDLFALIVGSFPPTPIGLGFSLAGLGGLLALNRSVDVDKLRAGLRTGMIARTFFLDQVTDLGAVIRDALEIFPVRDGQVVLGPIARITWGAPAVVEVDLGVFVEAPHPIRIYLAAAASLGLPTLEQRIVDIRLDALGVLDLERGTLALDAALHDSALAGYPLTGDMALRLGWGDERQFLLSIGGYHPHFTPPPGFPTLRRLALTAGDNPQLRLSSYLALTANTAQVGAQADLTASGGSFTIKGHVGFDALFEFVPFYFETEITASASIAWHGHRLLGVALDFVLSGPHPWHAKGDATFSVLWWDVSVGFDTTWGDATPAPMPQPPPIAGVLTDALGRGEAWSSELAAGEPPWVTFAQAAPTSTITVHPFAALVARERAVPLGYRITQFGNIPLATPQQFDITGVRIGTSPARVTTVADAFAPGQFTRLSADQRLAAPSFESFASGVRIAADEVRLGATARSTMDVDTEVVDPLASQAPSQQPRPGPVPPLIITHAPVVRPTGLLPLPPRGGPRVFDLPLVLASIDDLSITAEGAALAGGANTYAALREALAARLAATGKMPRLQIVPRIQVANHRAHVVVVSQDDNLRNVDFVDTITGRAMTRAEFVDAIHAGQYPDYYVRSMHGVPTPVSRPNATTADNLG